jgi:hypothetical protein
MKGLRDSKIRGKNIMKGLRDSKLRGLGLKVGEGLTSGTENQK